MPLHHGKSDKAFGENVKIEMEHGKPQKQAVAIAYSERRAAEHKKMAHGGSVDECLMCNQGYAEGGSVRRFKDDEGKEEIKSHDARPSKNMPGRFKSELSKDELEKHGFPSQLSAIDMGEHNYEEGGEVHPEEEGMDELMHGCAGELCEALEKKDKKGIVDALRAIMLSMKE